MLTILKILSTHYSLGHPTDMQQQDFLFACVVTDSDIL